MIQKQKRYINNTVFGMILFVNLYCFYLVNIQNNPIFIFISLLLPVIWGSSIWVLLGRVSDVRYRYSFWMIAMIVMVFLSSLQSYLRFGQSLFLGISRQKTVLVWAFMYFPIRKCIHSKRIRYDDLMRILWLLTIIQLVIYISQYISGPDDMFTYVHIAWRNNRTRYYYDPVHLDLMFMFALDAFAKTKGKERFFSALIAGTILFEVMFVQQYRLTSMGLIICLGMFVVIMRTKTYHKMIYMLFGIALLGVLFNTSLVQDVINIVFNNSYDWGMEIRGVGRRLYLETLLQHPILGGGMPHEDCMSAWVAVGETRRLHLVDNGVFAFAYIYGGLGIVWLVSLWGKFLQLGLRIRKKASECAFLLFPVFFVITGINEIHWYFEYGFVIFVIFLCLEEERIEMIRNLESIIQSS